LENRGVEVGAAASRKDSAIGWDTIGSDARGRVSHADGVKRSDSVGSYIAVCIGQNKGVLTGHVNGICKISSQNIAGVGETADASRIGVGQSNLRGIGLIVSN
jgi:hypothetical protein